MSFMVITVLPLQLGKSLFTAPSSRGSHRSWDLVMERDTLGAVRSPCLLGKSMARCPVHYGNRWGKPGQSTWLPARLGYTAAAQGSRGEGHKGIAILFHAKDHTGPIAQLLEVPSPLSSLRAAPAEPAGASPARPQPRLPWRPRGHRQCLSRPSASVAPNSTLCQARRGHSPAGGGCPGTAPGPAGLPVPITSRHIPSHPESHVPGPISPPVPPEDAVSAAAGRAAPLSALPPGPARPPLPGPQPCGTGGGTGSSIAAGGRCSAAPRGRAGRQHVHQGGAV